MQASRLVVVGVIMSAFVFGALALGDGHSEYGHPADCSCTSPLIFCEDEYVEGDSSYQDGSEYFGSPLFLNTTSVCCDKSGCTLQLQAGSHSVDVGGWSGTLEAALKGGLPFGYTVEAGGELKKNGETTVQVDVQAKQECGEPSEDCRAHDGKVGPGYTDRVVTTYFDHRCWGVHSEYYDCDDCDEQCISCGHCTNQQCQATVTFLSTEIKEQVTCGRSLTPAEESSCGCQCEEE